MKTLYVEAEVHWGFSVKIQGTGKAQPSLFFPPPSTLIGAIAMPLARRTRSGEIMLDNNGNFNSSVLKFQQIFAGASCKITGMGSYWTDINRYSIVMLQQNAKRRLDPTFRFGAIPTGKIYLPSQLMHIMYLIDEDAASRIFGESWLEQLHLAAYEISRIGSKESIVSVETVDIRNSQPVNGKVSTSFYFPAEAGNVIGGKEFFFADYWSTEYQFGKEAKLERYIIPGSKIPVTSSIVEVEVKGKGFTDGENLIIVNS